MTPEPRPLEKSYRPALRGLWFGLAALGLRVGASVIIGANRFGETGLMVTPAVKSIPFLDLAYLVALLVSVGYAAIAADRREWGRALVATWLVIAAAAVLPCVLAIL